MSRKNRGEVKTLNLEHGILGTVKLRCCSSKGYPVETFLNLFLCRQSASYALVSEDEVQVFLVDVLIDAVWIMVEPCGAWRTASKGCLE